MKILHMGDPEKIKAHHKAIDKKTFKCPICDCVWEARFSDNEIYAACYDSKWHSHCPTENCDGVGNEYKEENFMNSTDHDIPKAFEEDNCTKCIYYVGGCTQGIGGGDPERTICARYFKKEEESKE